MNGRVIENLERSRSDTIRAGNVWVDIQQPFYRMEENVSGCYAQKPLKSIDRIIRASSAPGDLVIDFFAHSGTALLASEMLSRRCFTADIDPIYADMRKSPSGGWNDFGRPGEPAGKTGIPSRARPPTGNHARRPTQNRP